MNEELEFISGVLHKVRALVEEQRNAADPFDYVMDIGYWVVWLHEQGVPQEVADYFHINTPLQNPDAIIYAARMIEIQRRIENEEWQQSQAQASIIAWNSMVSGRASGKQLGEAK